MVYSIPLPLKSALRRELRNMEYVCSFVYILSDHKFRSLLIDFLYYSLQIYLKTKYIIMDYALQQTYVLQA